MTYFQKRTGTEQEILYQGLCIKRQYDAEKEGYKITGLIEMESGRSLFTFGQRCTIKANEKMVSLYCGRNARSYSYWVEGNPEEQTINCLYGDEYRFSAVQQNKLITENGDIIGLVHVVKNFRCESYDPSQDDLKYDVLFKLNPETGESSILYKARNNRTRVIGYQDGVIYLLKNFRIYIQDVGGLKRELFLKLPKDTGYTFDRQGDHLIVIWGMIYSGLIKSDKISVFCKKWCGREETGMSGIDILRAADRAAGKILASLTGNEKMDMAEGWEAEEKISENDK